MREWIHHAWIYSVLILHSFLWALKTLKNKNARFSNKTANKIALSFGCFLHILIQLSWIQSPREFIVPARRWNFNNVWFGENSIFSAKKRTRRARVSAQLGSALLAWLMLGEICNWFGGHTQQAAPSRTFARYKKPVHYLRTKRLLNSNEHCPL